MHMCAFYQPTVPNVAGAHVIPPVNDGYLNVQIFTGTGAAATVGIQLDLVRTGG